ncbi:MAG: nucleotidyl transferase AbiEii/AbiGii toxin family protein [Solirubrobacteraceae bacterium]
MKLHEHPEFEQAILQAAAHHGLSEQFIEKDHYVTEILRITVQHLGNRAVFKGGTSLSKGWKLIKRFSEDIDLFIDLTDMDPQPGRHARDKIMKGLAEKVAEHPALTWLDDHRTGRGVSRTDNYSYETFFDEIPGMAPRVQLEPGIRSGRLPCQLRTITSLIGEFLTETGRSDLAEDIAGFDMTVLGYERTFVEKMFALNDRVIRVQKGGAPLARDARHYADLYVLGEREDVRAMLASEEYRTIREDCHEKNLEYFSDTYREPPGLSFAKSPALFPPAELREQLQQDYENQCNVLFEEGEPYPEFADVLACFADLKDLL